MKKIVYIISLVLLAYNIHAQESNRFGIQLGGNLSNQMANTNVSGITPIFKPCLQGGVFMDIPYKEKTSVVFGLSLIEKGSKSKYSNITGNASYLYLSLSAKDKYYLSKSFYLLAGSAVDWGWKGRSSTSNSKTVRNIFKGDKDMTSRRWDVDGLLGIGLDLGYHLSIESAFYFGLIDLNKSKDASLHHYGISCQVGYRF